jgi:hypothetical protein
VGPGLVRRATPRSYPPLRHVERRRPTGKGALTNILSNQTWGPECSPSVVRRRGWNELGDFCAPSGQAIDFVWIGRPRKALAPCEVRLHDAGTPS